MIVTRRHMSIITAAAMVAALAVSAAGWISEAEPPRVPLKYRTDTRSHNTAATEPPRDDGAHERGAPRSFREPKNVFLPLSASAGRPTRSVGRVRPAIVAGTADGPAVSTATMEVASPEAVEVLWDYRMMGSIRQHGESLAFLAKDEHVYVVAPGDMLDERVRLDALSATGIVLRDMITGRERALSFESEPGGAS